jgi:membrane protein DedA with SNARE-associated domain
MEFFSAYSIGQNILHIFFESLFQNKPALHYFLWTLAVGVAIWLPLFLLLGIGLYTMANRQGIKHKWMAFVPFLNILCLGRIAGECRFFNRKMKNAGVYAMIAQILASLAAASMLAAQMYLYVVYGEPTEVVEIVYGMELTYNTWPEATQGLGKAACWYYEHGNDFSLIFELIYSILMLVLVIAALKKYSPKHHALLAFLTLFVPLSRYIVFFVLRNREPIDYDAMVRARREAYMRQQQQYYQQYGNPYGRPQGGYGNPYGNPYGAPNQNQPQTPPANEDPFEEFASSAPSDGETNGASGDTDGFFD